MGKASLFALRKVDRYWLISDKRLLEYGAYEGADGHI